MESKNYIIAFLIGTCVAQNFINYEKSCQIKELQEIDSIMIEIDTLQDKKLNRIIKRLEDLE